MKAIKTFNYAVNTKFIDDIKKFEDNIADNVIDFFKKEMNIEVDKIVLCESFVRDIKLKEDHQLNSSFQMSLCQKDDRYIVLIFIESLLNNK